MLFSVNVINFNIMKYKSRLFLIYTTSLDGFLLKMSAQKIIFQTSDHAGKNIVLDQKEKAHPIPISMLQSYLPVLTLCKPTFDYSPSNCKDFCSHHQEQLFLINNQSHRNLLFSVNSKIIPCFLRHSLFELFLPHLMLHNTELAVGWK